MVSTLVWRSGARILVSPSALKGFSIFLYRASPVTYLVGDMLSTGLFDSPVNCSELELLTFNPPPFQSCSEYFSAYIAENGGDLLNQASSKLCRLCPVTATSQILQGFGIAWESPVRFRPAMDVRRVQYWHRFLTALDNEDQATGAS